MEDSASAMMHNNRMAMPPRPSAPTPPASSVDQDAKKGAVEDDRPGPTRPRTPGLDKEGLPNDPTAIAQDRIGAENDESQG